MKYQIVFICVSSLFAIINGFAISAAHVTRTSRSTRKRIQRELERKQREEIKKKCDYLNRQFPIEPNTCPTMIIDNYKILYSPVHDLLQYQYANCFVNPVVYSVWYICFSWVLFISCVIGMCMSA